MGTRFDCLAFEVTLVDVPAAIESLRVYFNEPDIDERTLVQDHLGCQWPCKWDSTTHQHIYAATLPEDLQRDEDDDRPPDHGALTWLAEDGCIVAGACSVWLPDDGSGAGTWFYTEGKVHQGVDVALMTLKALQAGLSPER